MQCVAHCSAARTLVSSRVLPRGGPVWCGASLAAVNWLPEPSTPQPVGALRDSVSPPGNGSWHGGRGLRSPLPAHSCLETPAHLQRMFWTVCPPHLSPSQTGGVVHGLSASWSQRKHISQDRKSAISLPGLIMGLAFNFSTCASAPVWTEVMGQGCPSLQMEPGLARAGS